MSFATLLERMAKEQSVPPVPSPEHAGGARKNVPYQRSTLGSPGSLTKPATTELSPSYEGRLSEALAQACRGLDITPAEVQAALSVDDVNDWRTGSIPPEALAAFALVTLEDRERRSGHIPATHGHRAVCVYCGPVWLCLPGRAVGCSWCFNRMEGLPIPRPETVACATCKHFQAVEHPNLGMCAAGEPPPACGAFWRTERWMCMKWLPKPGSEER